MHGILGVAGGLTNLSKTAACNVLLLGNQKKVLSGFSQISALPHTGFIYNSPIVQDMPPVSNVMYAYCKITCRLSRDSHRYGNFKNGKVFFSCFKK